MQQMIMNIPIYTKKLNTYQKFQEGNDSFIFILKKQAVIFPQLPS
jgi:hypothetical protein